MNGLLTRSYSVLGNLKQRGSQEEKQRNSESGLPSTTAKELDLNAKDLDLNGDCDVLNHQKSWTPKINDRSCGQPLQEALDVLRAVEQNILRRLERLEDRVKECERREQHSSADCREDNMLAATTSHKLPRCRWFRDESQMADHHGAVDNTGSTQKTTTFASTPRAASQLHREANDLLELLEVQKTRFEAMLGCEVPLTMATVANELTEAKSVAIELGRHLKRTAGILALDGFISCCSCCSHCHNDLNRAYARGKEFSPQPVLVHRSVCPPESPLPTHRHWEQPRELVSSADSSAPAMQEAVASIPRAECI